jgi:hypothetical protein
MHALRFSSCVFVSAQFCVIRCWWTAKLAASSVMFTHARYAHTHTRAIALARRSTRHFVVLTATIALVATWQRSFERSYQINLGCRHAGSETDTRGRHDAGHGIHRQHQRSDRRPTIRNVLSRLV